MRWLPCVGRMCGSRTFSLVSGLPSGLSAVGCPPWFEPFLGTTPESDSWPACLWVFWPWPSTTGLPPDCAADADQVSRFSCMMFPDVRGVFDCAGSRWDFVLAPPLVWSSPFVIGSTPWSFSFIAQYPACPCPCLRFALSLSADGARLGVMMGHYSCKTLSFSTSCRFIPAHNEPNLIRSEEHTSELQSRQYLVCRLLLEKKNTT